MSGVCSDTECLISVPGGEGRAGAAVRSAERRCQDVPSTKQTNPQTAGGGDQGEGQGEEETKPPCVLAQVSAHSPGFM